MRAWHTAGHSTPLVVRTSGSTGEPKQVVLGPAAVLASAGATLARLGGPGQWLLALPVHHVAGLQVLVRSLLAGEDPVVLDEHPDFLTATAALHGRRRYLSLVPTQLLRLLRDRDEVAALRSFDAVLLGGTAADPVLLARAREAGLPVVPTYGSSETCGGCVYDGRPLDGVAVKVDAGGRVHVAGPVLFDGYRDRPDLTAEVLVDGWLRSPDLGRLDDDGRLHVLGRVDDVVVSGGVNVALPAVQT
ncbi:MAG: AMP-binding protein, partial [Actinomycetota bacterium]|nr:AMP-binding protein [Actinomycetota bacterium]